MPLPEDIRKEVSYDYFWNSNSDRYYDANSFGDFFRPFFRNGVFNGEMQVAANEDMSVTVAAGHGFINGKMRHFLAETRLDLETSSGTLDRIDNVIIRRNDTERSITLLIQKGGNASSPVPPAIVRDAAIFDLKLAEVYIAAGAVKVSQAQITDTRMNEDVCGWVASTCKEIDFSQATAQFNQFFKEYKAEILSQYNAYLVSIGDTEKAAKKTYDEMKTRLDNLYEEYKRYLLDKYADYVQELDLTKEKAEEYYNTLKAALDALFDEYKNNLLSQYEDYVKSLEDTKTDAKTAYEQMQGIFTAYQAEQSAAFTEWFDRIKGQLSQDQAGHLQNQVDDLKENQTGSTGDLSNLQAVFEKSILQNRDMIDSLSFNQLAIFMELQALSKAEIEGQSDNVIVELFDAPVEVLKGYYDSVAKRVYA